MIKDYTSLIIAPAVLFYFYFIKASKLRVYPKCPDRSTNPSPGSPTVSELSGHSCVVKDALSWRPV